MKEVRANIRDVITIRSEMKDQVRQVVELTVGRTHERTVGRTDDRTDAQTYGRTDARTTSRTTSRTDMQMDELTVGRSRTAPRRNGTSVRGTIISRCI